MIANSEARASDAFAFNPRQAQNDWYNPLCPVIEHVHQQQGEMSVQFMENVKLTVSVVETYIKEAVTDRLAFDIPASATLYMVCHFVCIPVFGVHNSIRCAVTHLYTET